MSLTAPFTKEEFWIAMFSMHPDKCSGPDGYSPGFYQHFWSLCSDDIFKDCCTWLDTGQFPAELNMTNIALIPKGNAQHSMKDWRPFALCNVLYKLISKVLANRLKVVLPHCISDSQSAFVSGRSILDNAMVDTEVIDFMKTMTRGNEGYVALKLDISKAYDRMDWDYLRQVMAKMGFDHKWIHWMSLIYVLNQWIILSWLMVKLSVLLSRGVDSGKGTPYDRTYLLCVWRDCLILFVMQRKIIVLLAPVFVEALLRFLTFSLTTTVFSFLEEEDQARVMKNILLMYEAASGQSISLPKSEIFYSQNVESARKSSITNILGVQSVLGTGKYLGLSSMIGHDRTSNFAYIKDRVWQKINSWSSKCLSKAGREVMTKSVLQAILSYVLSIFQLPSTLINSIEKMMNCFWWGKGCTTHRVINWLSWENLSMHKSQGGMGFKDLSAFNLAMLGKQGWKFQTEPESLVSHIFKARYFPKKTYLTATIGHNPSYVWLNILHARFIVRGGARWSIAAGTCIPILGCIMVSVLTIIFPKLILFVMLR